jgi:hypothetical protein
VFKALRDNWRNRRLNNLFAERDIVIHYRDHHAQGLNPVERETLNAYIEELQLEIERLNKTD